MIDEEWLEWALFLADRQQNHKYRPLDELWKFFKAGAFHKKDDRILDFVQKEDQCVVPIGSCWYPSQLYELKRPPLLLFLKGNLELLPTPKLAMVGTRCATPLGKQRTQFWAKILTQKFKWTVISGLATGIDQAAHSGAFPNTIGILAFGHEHHYPRENLWLREKIEAEGA